MAIDTAAKRASAAAVLTFAPLVIPDGSVGQIDRQTSAQVYGGILAAEVEIVEATPNQLLYLEPENRDLILPREERTLYIRKDRKDLLWQ